MTEETKPTKEERVQQLWAKIFEVQQTIKSDLEEDKGSRLQWRPVAHWKVTGAVKMACRDQRLLCVPIVEDTRLEEQKTIATVSLVITDIDTGEQTVVGKYVGYGIDPMDKGPGKAVSYAVKTAMLKTFMMNIKDDTESDVVQDTAQYLLDSLRIEKVSVESPVEVRNDWRAKNQAWITEFRAECKATPESKRSPQQLAVYDILKGMASEKS